MTRSAPPPAVRAGRTVSVHNGYHGLRCSRAAVAALIHTLDAHAARLAPRASSLTHDASRLAPPGGCPPGELSLAFLTDAALARLHADFLADPTPTDVITFPGDPTLGTAGEICVSVDAARRCARALGRDFAAELALYLVHGWLHLAGHDDLHPTRKRLMRAAEARAFRLLRAAGPLPAFRLA